MFIHWYLYPDAASVSRHRVHCFWPSTGIEYKNKHKIAGHVFAFNAARLPADFSDKIKKKPHKERAFFRFITAGKSFYRNRVKRRTDRGHWFNVNLSITIVYKIISTVNAGISTAQPDGSSRRVGNPLVVLKHWPLVLPATGKKVYNYLFHLPPLGNFWITGGFVRVYIIYIKYMYSVYHRVCPGR